MIYDPRRLRKDSKEILTARNWGIGIVTTCLALGLFISEIERINEFFPDPMGFAYFALFILTGLLIFLWIWSTQKELDLCFDWLDPLRYTPPSTIQETLIILGLGVILTTLIFASRNPFFYAIIFTVYSTGLIFSSIFALREIGKALNASKKRLEAEISLNVNIEKNLLYKKGIEILEKYYVSKPHTKRHVIILVFCFFGFVSALFWQIKKIKVFGLAAYTLFFLIIFVSEIIIALWRIERDKGLRSVIESFNELDR